MSGKGGDYGADGGTDEQDSNGVMLQEMGSQREESSASLSRDWSSKSLLVDRSKDSATDDVPEALNVSEQPKPPQNILSGMLFWPVGKCLFCLTSYEDRVG